MGETVRLVVVVGARPQFIKAAALSRAIRRWNASDESGRRWEEFIVHTGQHYDAALSGNFFEELQIPAPVANLGVGSGPHALQTARMMDKLHEVFEDLRPDCVVVYGDTNSTLAAAVVASKMRVELLHIESGLRRNDRHTPEEINRIVTDHVSTRCYAPTANAMENLRNEGLEKIAVQVGDIMLDTTMWTLESMDESTQASVLESYGVQPDEFLLSTVHRAVNRRSRDRLEAIFKSLRALDFPTVLPLHPSTIASLRGFGLEHFLESTDTLRIVEPVPYATLLTLLKNCRAVVTDSGGLTKESYFFAKACTTLDVRTEWVESVHDGWNILTDGSVEQVLGADPCRKPDPSTHRPGVFGRGETAWEILQDLDSWLPK